MLPAAFQVVGDAAQLFNFPECVRQGLDVRLPAARAIGRPTVGEGGAQALANLKDVRGSGGSDTDGARGGDSDPLNSAGAGTPVGHGRKAHESAILAVAVLLDANLSIGIS